jgi:hypothetical protein
LEITIFGFHWISLLYWKRTLYPISPEIISMKDRLSIPKRIGEFYIYKNDYEKKERK